MSDLLNYIKTQKNKGLDDYTILQSTINMSKNNNIRKNKKLSYKKISMTGGNFTLTAADRKQINVALEQIDPNNDTYKTLKAAADTQEDLELDGYDNISNVLEKINSLPKKTPDVINTALPDGNAVEGSADETAIGDDMSQTNTGDNGNSATNNDIYVTLNPGDILYFPTETIKQFDENMLFVDVPEVLDQSTQRSFTMFFADDKAYAKRFAGIWSLNKRPVYLHKLAVKEGRPITRIKRISSKIISDKVNNNKLAHGICGQSVDGTIHGIKIEATYNKKTVAEYYICNPSEYFTCEATWMINGSTDWIQIYPSTVDDDDRLDEAEPIEPQGQDLEPEQIEPQGPEPQAQEPQSQESQAQEPQDQEPEA
jgi:hypothetical protein